MKTSAHAGPLLGGSSTVSAMVGGVCGSGSMASATALSLCGGSASRHASAAFVRSVTVLVAVQKMGGELVQPIGSASGNAISGLSDADVGKTTPNSGMCLGAR